MSAKTLGVGGGGSTGLFRPVNGHNSKNLQDMHTKLYINQHEIPRRLVYNTIHFEDVQNIS